ncbi:type II toxin-antitoxin system RelE/ParE family toxin [Candidatus Bathyarchaeota archaeon]|nr:type II toxin-antitoxin system RelE/ParE family toxin [Candidatus Bathyarchaeota archaeon]
MGKYSLKVTKRFEKDFRKFEIKLRRRLDSAIRKLETNPYLGKPLRGELMGKRSLRVGDYRVIYAVDEDKKVVILFTVGHRKAVYG